MPLSRKPDLPALLRPCDSALNCNRTRLPWLTYFIARLANKPAAFRARVARPRPPFGCGGVSVTAGTGIDSVNERSRRVYGSLLRRQQRPPVALRPSGNTSAVAHASSVGSPSHHFGAGVPSSSFRLSSGLERLDGVRPAAARWGVRRRHSPPPFPIRRNLEPRERRETVMWHRSPVFPPLPRPAIGQGSLGRHQ
jgi:hypothetical protein